MANPAQMLLHDTLGMARVCGPVVTARWLLALGQRLPQVLRDRNLHPADAALGEGPFAVRLRGARARVVGEHVISGVREIWVRDVYLGGGFLAIRDGDTVVDLGANMGNFTLLALGHGPRVRVVSVEANPLTVPALGRSLAENPGFPSRATVINAFVGGEGAVQRSLRGRPGGGEVPTLREAELLERGRLERIDFLKCDIEGSEFELLGPDSLLLAMTRQIAIEVHRVPGHDADAFAPMLERLGFEVRVSHVGAQDLTLLGRRRR